MAQAFYRICLRALPRGFYTGRYVQAVCGRAVLAGRSTERVAEATCAACLKARADEAVVLLGECPKD